MFDIFPHLCVIIKLLWGQYKVKLHFDLVHHFLFVIQSTLVYSVIFTFKLLKVVNKYNYFVSNAIRKTNVTTTLFFNC